MTDQAVLQDARRYLAMLHKRRGIVITCLGMSLLIAVLYNYTTRPVYQATTQILIDRDTPNVLPNKELVELVQSGADYYQTQYQLLKGRTLAEKAVERLGLQRSPELLTGPMMSPLERAQRLIGRVPASTVDPVYFDGAYYLGPDKGGAKPYALLTRALRETGRCALGRWAARGKQYIVMIRPVAEGLVMQQLLHAAEVRPISEVEIPKTEVRPAELALATQLIEQQAAAAFDPSAYTDEVKARIEAAVQKKVEGQEIAVAEEAAAPTAQVIDLMEALRASLKKKAPEAAKPAAETAARKPPKRVQQEAPPAKRAGRK